MLTNSQIKSALRQVDQALKTPRAHPSPPPELHADIMKAVKAAAQEDAAIQNSQAQPAILLWLLRTGWHWALAPSLLVMILAAVWYSKNPSRFIDAANGDSPLSHPMANLTTPQLQPPSEVIAVGFAPLAQEMELFSQDVRKAAEFLVASLPFTSTMLVDERPPEP